MGAAPPHHDGSSLYVADPSPAPGDRVAVFVRVPHGAGVSRVAVRWTPDAEPRFREATVDRSDHREAWWRADLDVVNPVTSYRFLLGGDVHPYRWLTAAGVVGHDVPDGTDFRLTTFEPPPDWVTDAVVYQIFPDRFHRSAHAPPPPDWAIPARWDDPVALGRRRSMRQVYGGDLAGIEEQLGHLEALGVNAVYLNPFFPAPSNHRYNASSFEDVDPALGGEDALASLVAALHRRGMRAIGDLTTNHCGSEHPWFLRARAEPDSPEGGFFYPGPDGRFACWFDVPTLPKLNHASAELRRRLYEGPDSAAARWLRPPFDLDGWRIDVANMTGRHGADEMNHAVATALRATLREAKPGAYLLAEHAHDATGDLAGDGWHGTMSYGGFTRPLWCWLGHAEPLGGDFLGVPARMPRLGGPAVAATVDAFRAGIPWRTWVHNLTLLGSHDTSRWWTVAAARGQALVGAAVLLSFPGVPSILYGDEVGLQGAGSLAARRPMPWDEARWDGDAMERYRDLIRLRRGSDALRRGGFRWVHVGEDVLVYLRETGGQRVLVQAARAAHDPVSVDPAFLGTVRGGRAAHLLGGSPLPVTTDGAVLPADGPAFHAWDLAAD